MRLGVLVTLILALSLFNIFDGEASAADLGNRSEIGPMYVTYCTANSDGLHHVSATSRMRLVNASTGFEIFPANTPNIEWRCNCNHVIMTEGAPWYTNLGKYITGQVNYPGEMWYVEYNGTFNYELWKTNKTYSTMKSTTNKYLTGYVFQY